MTRPGGEGGRKPGRRRTPAAEPPPAAPERIAKYLASCGVASRRDVERLIAEGRVEVDGAKLDTPAFKVTGREDIRVDGRPVRPPETTRLWRYHKPPGLVTTNRDPEGRPTVFDELPVGLPRVVTIGRLDLNTEGLLLLTNDGELARTLELPATGLVRTYRARAFGSLAAADIDRLRVGIVHEGVAYGPIEAEVERRTGANSWIRVSLKEGRKREVRRALETFGLRVNRLIRTSYGPFQLGDLTQGEVEEVPAAELLAALGDLLGARRRPRPSRPPAARSRRIRAGEGPPARKPPSRRKETAP